MRLLLIILACVLGCGGSSDSIYPLAGSEWIQRLGDRSCDHQLTFSEDGQYLEAWICILGDYTQRAEVNKGTYHIDGHTLTVGLDQSSCSMDASRSVDFALNGDSLEIFTSEEEVSMMNRLIFPPGEPAAEIPVGCFDDDTWVFTPMAIHPI
jgi:hypothetical protein